MRKLTYHVATTADGFIARADGSWDFFPTEGGHIPEFVAAMNSYGAVLMGRKTYEVGLKVGVADPYPHLDSYVFSRTLKESPSPRVKLVSGDAAAVVRTLKAREGRDLWLCGGGELASVLFAEGLIDEVLLKLNPVLLGSGTPLLTHLKDPTRLELLSTKVYRGGVVLLHYSVPR
ncbi:dihydrofolate reductase family protein [Stigmatella aurantiaca]|uniref:RibD domain protein n=1 Tax=Stigmatella aurantiaca (strain DW4/3-1) TaxID=378806 RepID=Q08PP9_STIAD|nr:dihydrofolate reductase family protein [Stigmatella aurantiaca]ADO76027.1 RibD domain protein [Stigmatella aurantiaca DW4/3-1]EAU62459.1 riboflavin biosynthesis protein RibD C-terminal domain protein [Stigmatella aurantiaca DW4/3-1]